MIFIPSKFPIHYDPKNDPSRRFYVTHEDHTNITLQSLLDKVQEIVKQLSSKTTTQESNEELVKMKPTYISYLLGVRKAFLKYSQVLESSKIIDSTKDETTKDKFTQLQKQIVLELQKGATETHKIKNLSKFIMSELQIN